jgi:hypothetical protein
MQLSRVLAAESKKDDAIAELQAAREALSERFRRRSAISPTFIWRPEKTIWRKPLIELWSRPSRITPNYIADWDSALLLEKKFPEAQQEFLTAVRLKRDWPDAYVDLAFAASENKNYELDGSRAQRARLMWIRTSQTPVCRRFASFYAPPLTITCATSRTHRPIITTSLKWLEGKYPDQEWQARHRLIAIEPKKH